MISPDDYLSVGVVTRSHGLKGEVVVDTEPGATDFLTALPPLWILDGEEPVRLELKKIQQVSRRFVFRFEGYRKREVGDRLIGKRLWAKRSDLEMPEGAYAVHDLLGIAVRLEDGAVLGTLADVLLTGANDVYVVRGERGEWYLPATDQVVLEMDLGARTMTVKLLPGMEPQTPTGAAGTDGE